MFNPYPFDDMRPLNRLSLPDELSRSIVAGNRNIAECLSERIKELRDRKQSRVIVGMDGYPGADWLPLIRLLSQRLSDRGFAPSSADVAEVYKSSEEVEAMLRPYLTEDPEGDPIRLFGRLYEGGFTDLFDQSKLDSFASGLKRGDDPSDVLFIYGCGAGVKALREHCDLFLYFDVIPKDAVLRVKNGEYDNLADDSRRPYKQVLRRCYYFDYEICGRLRTEMLKNNLVDYYLASSDKLNMKLVPRDAFNALCSQLVKQPFRCKPVYNEGVWGGYYTKKLRQLPDEMKNCAWVFDLIPLEVSVFVEVGDHTIDIPYFTFVRKEGVSLMGQACVDAFDGYFPIRFNYDDTYHSNGNMSIQVHPTDEFTKDEFGEHGRQDESYYVIATGHGAKTYCGFNDNIDIERFWTDVRRSEREHTPVEYDAYVHSVPSVPGRQFLLPAGTIHSSGRNQLILEIGSLTIGSYTFKLYDYLRMDLDGTPRPIHSKYGERVLQTQRQAAWVNEHLVPEPRVITEGTGWRELVVGEHELLYFSLRRIELEKIAVQSTGGVFHVLVLVDGERVRIEAVADPSLSYTMDYLDMVVVPAAVGEYRIVNLGDQPVCMHKTHLKDGFADCL